MIKNQLDVEKFERPRKKHKLLNVLSKDEVKAILGSLTNIKHKTKLSLMYACGLRRKGAQYFASSLSEVLTKAVTKAKIKNRSPCIGCDTVMPRICLKLEPT